MNLRHSHSAPTPAPGAGGGLLRSGPRPWHRTAERPPSQTPWCPEQDGEALGAGKGLGEPGVARACVAVSARASLPSCWCVQRELGVRHVCPSVSVSVHTDPRDVAGGPGCPWCLLLRCGCVCVCGRACLSPVHAPGLLLFLCPRPAPVWPLELDLKQCPSFLASSSRKGHWRVYRLREEGGPQASCPSSEGGGPVPPAPTSQRAT